MPDLQLSDDLTIFYQDHSPKASPTVLLLHGLGVNCESWGMQVPALQKAGFRILRPDIRGFGRSTWPRGGVTIRQLSGDRVALLKSIDISTAIVIGISMGGTLALQMAIDTPDLVSKLVLINTFACLRPKYFSSWLYYASRFFMAHIVGIRAQANIVSNHLFPDPEDTILRDTFIDQISQANPTTYRATMRAIARFNVSDRLKEITIPTLVVSGEQDTTVPIAIQVLLAQNIPGARHEIIPGADHAVTVEKPARVNHLLIDFLSSAN